MKLINSAKSIELSRSCRHQLSTVCLAISITRNLTNHGIAGKAGLAVPAFENLNSVMTNFGDITYDLLTQRFQNATEYHEIMSRFAQVKFQLNGFQDHSPLVEKNCNEVAAAVMSASAKLFLEMLETLLCVEFDERFWCCSSSKAVCQAEKAVCRAES